MKLIFRGVFNPPGYIHIHNNQFKELSFNVTPQINDSVTGFEYQSECASHHPNALAIRMRRVSIWGGVPPCLGCANIFDKSPLIQKQHNARIAGGGRGGGGGGGTEIIVICIDSIFNGFSSQCLCLWAFLLLFHICRNKCL